MQLGSWPDTHNAFLIEPVSSKLQDLVERTEKKPPFKQLHPEYEGVCMGYK